MLVYYYTTFTKPVPYYNDFSGTTMKNFVFLPKGFSDNIMI